MKRFATFARALLITSLLAAGTAQASAILSTDPTQLGRLSRNGVPQDWDGTEAYPGVINPTVAYHYKTYAFNVYTTPYVELSVDSTSANLFVSVYQTSYDPTNLAANWLGDEGSSGNYGFDTVVAHQVDARYFQITALLNSTIIVVVNETTANAGVGAYFGLNLLGWDDTQYSDPDTARTLVVPEPSTMLLFLAPVVMLGAARARRRSPRQEKLAA